MAESSSRAYLLGDLPQEHERLRQQHLLWREQTLRPLREAGIGPGMSLLEVGCGSGALLEDLLPLVGDSGRLAGMDQSARSLAAARALLPERVQLCQGDLRTWTPEGSWDGVIARWVLSFLSATESVVRRLASCLRPGGVLMIQDYHHSGFSCWPEERGFELAVRAMRQAYRERGGDLFLAGKIPGQLRRAGLQVERIEPQVMASQPGGGAFQWVDAFVSQHAPQWQAEGLLTEEELTEVQRCWERLRSNPDAVVFTPKVVTILGRRI